MTGPELVAFMESGGWTVQTFAVALDVSLTTVSRWRNGRSAMSPAWERRIMRLRVPAERRRVARTR